MTQIVCMCSSRDKRGKMTRPRLTLDLTGLNEYLIENDEALIIKITGDLYDEAKKVPTTMWSVAGFSTQDDEIQAIYEVEKLRVLKAWPPILGRGESNEGNSW